MKYFIDSKRAIEETTDVEREMPRRVEIAKIIAKRYRTDVQYFYADQMGMIFIVDIDDTEQLAEIVLLLRRAGLTPTAHPLVESQTLSQILLEMAEIA